MVVGGWCVDMQVCRWVGRGTCGLQTRGLIKLGGPVVESWLGRWPDLDNPNYLLFDCNGLSRKLFLVRSVARGRKLVTKVIHGKGSSHARY